MSSREQFEYDWPWLALAEVRICPDVILSPNGHGRTAGEALAKLVLTTEQLAR